jgi:hypothetical protein
MEKLILHPTTTAQWYELVNEAQVASQLLLTEATESYMVFMLMRFTEQPQIAESVLALEFLHGVKQVGEQRVQQLRDVGDKCLLFSGFYPEQAQRRHVPNDYFINLGQSAYATIADHPLNTDEIFTQLSEAFEHMMRVLQQMRVLDAWQTPLCLDEVVLKKH